MAKTPVVDLKAFKKKKEKEDAEKVRKKKRDAVIRKACEAANKLDW